MAADLSDGCGYWGGQATADHPEGVDPHQPPHPDTDAVQQAMLLTHHPTAAQHRLSISSRIACTRPLASAIYFSLSPVAAPMPGKSSQFRAMSQFRAVR